VLSYRLPCMALPTRPVPLALLFVVVTLASCSQQDATEPTPTDAPAPPSQELAAHLIESPPGDGSWNRQEDTGSPIDVLEPVCETGYPPDRPLSVESIAQLFVGGDPNPVVIQSVDRFDTAADAAAIVDMHRQSAAACTSWTRNTSDGLMEFSVRILEIEVPHDGFAFEVTATINGEALVTQQAIYREDEILVFLGHLADASAAESILSELIDLATG